MVFFNPSDELVQSIVDYAGDRIIMEIGFGEGRLMSALKEKGGRVTGIEWFLDDEVSARLRREGINHLAGKAQNYPGLLSGLKERGLLIFARPCHSNFVEECISLKDPATEALYITVPENLHLYNDLGKYEEKAKQIHLKGNSEDNEVIYSIC